MRLSKEELLREAKAFINQYYSENELDGAYRRWQEIEDEIALTGSYTHTFEELDYGAKLAWRNSNRCIGRLFWKTLKTIDAREVATAEEFEQALEHHLAAAEQRTKIRSTITVFAPLGSTRKEPFRIKNYTLLMYAGYREGDRVIGDPKNVDFTRYCESLGWKGRGGDFDVLPVVYSVDEGPDQWYQIPEALVSEVEISHPEYAWVAELGLKWYKLPVISFMGLRVGGVLYPAAPFNGWYMLDEIATRNFGDEQRYNTLPVFAEHLKLDRSSPFWKEKALLVLNEAVYYSFEAAHATIVDHHKAVDQFMKFVEQEQALGRRVTGDWSWLVPPTAGSTTAVFHTEMKDELKFPNFVGA